MQYLCDMKEKDIEEVRAFNRVYTVFMGILNQRFLQSKFSLVETRVLHAALHQDGITPSEITALLNIDKSYLSRIITNLLRRKVLTKRKSAEDGRSVHLSITEIGRREFEKLNEASNLQVAGLLAQLSESDCKRLVKNMAEIRSILENR